MQITVAERQQPGKHPALITLFPFAFQIHLALRRHNGFDIVGLAQGFHSHIIIHAQQDVFQIGTGKAVFGNLTDAPILHIRAKDARQHRTDLGFTLAAVALNDHHALTFVGGNQTVTGELLQGGDVLRIEQSVQKVQPDHRRSSIGIVGNRQTASHDSQSALGKCAIQKERTVGNMNAILLRREVGHMGSQFQHFQNVGDLPGNIVHGTEFQLVVNLPTQREIVCYPTIGRKKSSVCEDDSALTQKFFTEQSFIDVLPIKPHGQVHIRRFPVLRHAAPPPFSFLRCSPART